MQIRDMCSVYEILALFESTANVPLGTMDTKIRVYVMTNNKIILFQEVHYVYAYDCPTFPFRW
jgi:hypothetical protein